MTLATATPLLLTVARIVGVTAAMLIFSVAFDPLKRAFTRREARPRKGR